ncbi:hypothetical protein [Chryseobacterium sp.]|uniref:hypothetical protein n=1 Tax=Chryseobacterium sp. TaxID=1871047 RepID=UPI0024E27209|nr:hypothetical protein [Chryseobacterium sp.]
MIQFILMLLGLTFSNNNADTTTHNNQDSGTVTTYSTVPLTPDDGGPVTGETGQTPPPRK